jgi:hypothetical protein
VNQLLTQKMKMKCNTNSLRKTVSALAVAALMLPALAQAGEDHGKGNEGRNNGHQFGRDQFWGGKGDPTITSTPEPNTAYVLIPFLGAVLVVGSMHLWRRQKKASV